MGVALLEAVIEQVSHDRVHLVRDESDRLGGKLDPLEPRREQRDDGTELRVELVVRLPEVLHRRLFELLGSSLGLNGLVRTCLGMGRVMGG